MAVRCSSWRPNSFEIFRPFQPSPPKFSRRILVQAKPSSVKSLIVSKTKIHKHLCEIKEFLESEKVRELGFVMKQTSDSDERQASSVLINVEDLFAHQGIKKWGFSIGAFVVGNALMLTLPFQASAETCIADSSPFQMPLLLAVAVVGATVGGLLARQRKGELKKLNEQLRQINAALRKQAKIESYAPTLSYAPVGTRIPEDEVVVDSRKQDLISLLRSGKKFLRSQDAEKAYEVFKSALVLAKDLKDSIKEKKAARGLGASLQRLGKYREAIKFHSMVLEISNREGEDSGNAEAYGAIADCYTELGDLEQAAKFYDKYIMRLED